MSKVISMTLQEIGKQEVYDNVWVLNTTEGEDRGQVFFTVANAQGTREDNVVVPITWVPLNLTAQVTRAQLLDSASFRRALSVGFLAVISDDEAKKLLEKSGGSEEARRVQQEMVGRASEDAKSGMGNNDAKPAAVSNGATSAPEISVPVSMFIEAMDTVTDAEALNSYRTLGRLKLPEMRAILRKAKDLRYEQIGREAASDIKTMREAQEEEDRM